jgi:hypothetical protein
MCVLNMDVRLHHRCRLSADLSNTGDRGLMDIVSVSTAVATYTINTGFHTYLKKHIKFF